MPRAKHEQEPQADLFSKSAKAVAPIRLSDVHPAVVEVGEEMPLENAVARAELLVHQWQDEHRSLSEQVVDANRTLAKLAASGVAAQELERIQAQRSAFQAERADLEAQITQELRALKALIRKRNAAVKGADQVALPESKFADEAGEAELSGIEAVATPTDRGLIRQRHPNRDFFLADLFDYALKDDGASMEAPIFTLSTKPDLSVWQWKSKDGSKSVKVAPSVLGRATQHDKDVLIYVVSQLTEALNRGREDAQNRTVRFTVYDFLVTTNRGVSGDDYMRLQQAFERLAGTRVTTDIRTGGERVKQGFGIIDEWRIIEKSQTDERMIAVEVTLSRWLYNAVQAFEVLTIHPDYFRLRKPLARRLYELARKHCGHQSQWSISLMLLQEKTGSKSSIREFRRAIKAVADDDSLPEYRVWVSDDDKVTFHARASHRLIAAAVKPI